MKYLRVNNWETFQHYKDRNPPWIKLHRDLLRDYDFIRLQDASKMQLMLIWLLASQMDNKIPADPKFIQSQLGLKSSVNLKELIDKGFLVDDSNALADCKQVAIAETETETEAYSKEAEKEVGDFDLFWFDYGKIGNKQQALKAYNKAIKGTSHEEIIRGLTNYQQYCRDLGQEQRFIKHASTWLNNRGWEDDYTVRAVESNDSRRSRELQEAAVRGMLRAENPDF